MSCIALGSKPEDIIIWVTSSPYSSEVRLESVEIRQVAFNCSAAKRPSVIFVLPMSTASNIVQSNCRRLLFYNVVFVSGPILFQKFTGV